MIKLRTMLAVNTGRIIPDSFYSTVTFEAENIIESQKQSLAGLLSEYELDFRMTKRFTCPPEDVNAALRNAITGMQRDLYSDLYPLLITLKEAIYEGNRREALRLVGHIEALTV